MSVDTKCNMLVGMKELEVTEARYTPGQCQPRGMSKYHVGPGNIEGCPAKAGQFEFCTKLVSCVIISALRRPEAPTTPQARHNTQFIAIACVSTHSPPLRILDPPSKYSPPTVACSLLLPK